MALTILTGLLVIVTGYYAYITRKIAESGDETTRELRNLVKMLESGQKLQDEANFIQYVMVMGNTHNVMRGDIAKQLPHFEARRQQEVKPL